MSQRNPMNERYQQEGHTGATRKSAASAKPKAKAASTVTVQSTKKTPQQKKAERKAENKRLREEQRRLDQKYYTPDTQRYKNLRRGWWAALIGAVLCTIISFLGRSVLPDWAALFTLFLAYGLIILAFYIDFSKIRRERRAYQERMIALEEKQMKAERAAARAEQGKKGQVKAKAAQKVEEPAEKQQEEAPKKGLFGGMFGKKAKGADAQAADSEAK